MIIVALADIHGHTHALKSMAHDLTSADVVLIAGDLTNSGQWREAARVVNAIRQYNKNVLAVPGNWDGLEADTYLTAEGINLHRQHVMVDGVGFLGLGGSLPIPGTPNEFTERQYGAFLKEASADLAVHAPLILLSHQPPIHTINDRMWNREHVGSESIRGFIAQRQPAVCFTGHIHEGCGIDTIGQTRIVNPGPLRLGGYAYVTVALHVEVVEIRGGSPPTY